MRLTFWITVVLLFATGAGAQVRCDAADLATRLLGARRMVLADPAALPAARQDIDAALRDWSGTVRHQRDGPASQRDGEAILALAALSRQVSALVDSDPRAARDLIASVRASGVSHLATLAVLRSGCDARDVGEWSDGASLGLRDGSVADAGGAPSDGRSSRAPSVPIATHAWRGAVAVAAFAVSAGAARRILLYRRKQARRRRRYAIGLPVAYRHGGQLFDGRIIDINCFGLKIQHAGDLEKDDVASIGLLGQWRGFRVVWRNAHYAGGVLLDPLSLPTLMLLVASRRTTAPTGEEAQA